MGGWFRERKEAEEERVTQERERRSESGVPGGNGSSGRVESCGRGGLSKGRGCEKAEGCSGKGNQGERKGLEAGGGSGGGTGWRWYVGNGWGSVSQLGEERMRERERT